MRIYISGPVTNATPEQLENFEKCEAWLEKQYETVTNPLAIVKEYAEDKGIGDVPYHVAMRECIKVLPYQDVICLLPGWEESDGACLEYQVARAMGLQVMLWQ